jgi:hypothetical protein
VLKDWVQVNLTESGTAFEKLLPQDVKDLPWYQKAFSGAVLARENERLKAALREKDQELLRRESHISGLNSELENAETEVGNAESAKRTAEKAKKDAELLLGQTQATLDVINRLEKCRSVFTQFIDDYLANNKATSIWSWGIFGSFHGSHGRNRARFISHELNVMIKPRKCSSDDVRAV